jgi:hypothetical protein
MLVVMSAGALLAELAKPGFGPSTAQARRGAYEPGFRGG